LANQSLGTLTVDLVANTAGFERGMNQAERALASATREAKRQGDSLDRLIGQIDPTVAAYSRLDKMEQQLAAHRKANRLDETDYKGYLAQINAAREAIGKTDRVMMQNGQTAKQYAAALRGVPAQFTDIAVSLQAGQNPLTVFLQQGGQLKDMFGGAGEAARALGGYILGLVNPFTVAAAAAAVLALAYKQGSDEATAFTTALVTSGNAAGTTSGQLADMAQDVSRSVGTVGKAASVLAQLAGSSRIAVDSFDEIAIAAIKWEEATGKAAEETVKDFEKIAKDPVKAIRELNDSMNFLTASTYAQIVALQKQGDTQAAANLAEQAYSEALTARSNKIVENLGYVETAWKNVKEFAKDAWDAFLDVGRAETPEERLTRLQKKLEEIRSGGRGGRAQFGLGIGPGGDEAAAEKAVTDELVAQEESRKRAAAAAKQVAQERAGIAKIDEESAKKETRAAVYREDAGQRMLDGLRQQYAELQLQASTNEKLGAQAQALARFEQQIADIKSKDVRTADQKSLLASEELLRAQLKRNVALEQEITARKDILANEQKLAAFHEAQQSKLTSAQEGLNSQLTGLGLGEKARERLKEDLKIREDYNKELDRLNKEYNSIENPTQSQTDLYDQETAILEENLAARLVMQQDYYNQVDEASNNMFLGLGESWNNYLDEATNVAAQTQTLFDGAFTGLTDALYGFVTTGKLSFQDLAASFAQTALKMLIQYAAAQAIAASLNAFTSTAAIPIIGPIAAPGAAASALAFATGLSSQIAGIAGMAHDGIDSVPETGTWLLQKGERVTTAQTSAKLDKTLDSVANGVPSNKGSTTVNLIEDASKAGQTRTRLDEDGIQEVIDVWISKLYSDDDVMEALNRKTGIRGVGQ
jgi:lambda family phage tail tape measure protein